MRILLRMETNWTRVAGAATVRTWTSWGRKVILSVSGMGFVEYVPASDFSQAFWTRFFMYTAAMIFSTRISTSWRLPASCIEDSS